MATQRRPHIGVSRCCLMSCEDRARQALVSSNQLRYRHVHGVRLLLLRSATPLCAVHCRRARRLGCHGDADTA
jgi:hypothetical protein